MGIEDEFTNVILHTTGFCNRTVVAHNDVQSQEAYHNCCSSRKVHAKNELRETQHDSSECAVDRKEASRRDWWRRERRLHEAMPVQQGGNARTRAHLHKVALAESWLKRVGVTIGVFYNDTILMSPIIVTLGEYCD